jgi:hypothetical protein
MQKCITEYPNEPQELHGLPAERIAVRDWLMGQHVTLDGRPARIVGRLCAFATVWTHEQDHEYHWRDVDYSWDTVRHIVANGGEFRS